MLGSSSTHYEVTLGSRRCRRCPTTLKRPLIKGPSSGQSARTDENMRQWPMATSTRGTSFILTVSASFHHHAQAERRLLSICVGYHDFITIRQHRALDRVTRPRQHTVRSEHRRRRAYVRGSRTWSWGHARAHVPRSGAGRAYERTGRAMRLTRSIDRFTSIIRDMWWH